SRPVSAWSAAIRERHQSRYGTCAHPAPCSLKSDQRSDEDSIGKLAAAATAGNCIQKIGAGRAIPAAPAYLARLASLSDIIVVSDWHNTVNSTAHGRSDPKPRAPR